MKKKLYIAYGSNMNLKQMAQRCPGAKYVNSTVIEDRRLVFAGRSQGAVATLEAAKDGQPPPTQG